MATWKHVLMLSVCVLGMVSTGATETTLTIATGEYPPYISARKDESFLTDVFESVGKEMGVTFAFKFMPWKRCELALEELTAWGAIPYAPTPEREQKFHYSDPLYFRRSLFFAHSVNKKQPQIPYATLADLKGYRIGGVIGYYYEQPFREAGLNVEYVPTEEQNFKKLGTGRVDVIPADEVLGWYFIKKIFPLEEKDAFFTLSKPLSTGGDFLITSKQYPETQTLLANFNRALKTIKGNGVYQKILEQHGIALTY